MNDVNNKMASSVYRAR